MKKTTHISFIVIFLLITIGSIGQTLTLSPGDKRFPKIVDSVAAKVKTPDTVDISLNADGNVKSLISNSNSTNSEATGNIGIDVVRKWDRIATDEKTNQSFRVPKMEFYRAFINIASTVDTLKSNFGSIVLTPASGKQFTSGLMEYYFKYLCRSKFKIGIHVYASGSSSNWKYGDTSKLATVFGGGILLTKDIVQDRDEKNPIFFGVEIGLSYRGIFGNVTNDKLFYEKMMGTTGTSFLGFEGGLRITFSQITAAIHGYWLNDISGKKKIDGITGFQLTGGISISGAIFKKQIVTNN